MNLSIWDPFREMDELFDRYGRVRKRLPSDAGQSESMSVADWHPAVNISETDTEYRVHAELPGIDKKDVKVSVDDGVLTVQGSREMRKEEEDKKRKYHRVECSYGNFSRSFSLPDSADWENIAADFKDGVLDVSIPKLPEPQKKGIEVDVK
jgi:HSP20 family protein